MGIIEKLTLMFYRYCEMTYSLRPKISGLA